MCPHKNMLWKKAYDHSKDQKNYLPSCVLFVRVVSTLKFYDDALLNNTSFIDESGTFDKRKVIIATSYNSNS